VCGDFNAPPDSDEIRMLTGLTAACRVAWRDAWEAAGPGEPAHTWSNANPWAAPMLLRDGRIDYVFVGPFGAGGRGQPVAARLVGREPVGGVVASDHYGVLADLRY
jgi:endonuclease/exonuclease/phosphatase family metal-dependent hydrolase